MSARCSFSCRAWILKYNRQWVQMKVEGSKALHQVIVTFTTLLTLQLPNQLPSAFLSSLYSLSYTTCSSSLKHTIGNKLHLVFLIAWSDRSESQKAARHMKASSIHSGIIHQGTNILFRDYIILTAIISALMTLDVNGVDVLLWFHASFCWALLYMYWTDFTELWLDSVASFYIFFSVKSLSHLLKHKCDVFIFVFTKSNVNVQMSEVSELVFLCRTLIFTCS